MPELAEVEYFRKQWNPGLNLPIQQVLLHPKARIFRGTDSTLLEKTLKGAVLEYSEARGKQMLFVAHQPAQKKLKAWMGVHLGMTGKLSCEAPDYVPLKHDHLVLQQKKQSLVFADFRLFGRVLFAVGTAEPEWWRSLPPELLSDNFKSPDLTAFLQRRGKAPLKAVLLMQERFPGLGNWMADEILWRAELHPRRLAGSLSQEETKRLYREIRWVCREAIKIIGVNWSDPPNSWLFLHRWKKGGHCPKTGAALKHETIGGRTTCWSPGRQKL